MTHLVNLKALESLNVMVKMSATGLESVNYLYSGKSVLVLVADYVNQLGGSESQTESQMDLVGE